MAKCIRCSNTITNGGMWHICHECYAAGWCYDCGKNQRSGGNAYCAKCGKRYSGQD